MNWKLKQINGTKYLDCEEAGMRILISPVLDRPISWLIEEMEAVETLAKCKQAA